MNVRPASGDDHDAVVALLRSADLPLAGIPRTLSGFYVAEDGRQVVGAIGLEAYGEHGLLRSAVVHPKAMRRGVGRALVDRLLSHASEHGIASVYLLTTTAEGYFGRLGFERIGREDVPDGVRASVEFREACPASATVMRKVVEGA